MKAYHKNDLVRVKVISPGMSHFQTDCDAIVQYTYDEKYGRKDALVTEQTAYSIIVLPHFGGCAWYNHCDLTFIRHLEQAEVDALEAAAKAVTERESELPWIVANWSRFKAGKSYPSASVGTLMKLVGITNPWGSQGEGICLAMNQRLAFQIMDPILSTGNLEQVESFIAQLTPTKGCDIGFQ